MITPTPEVLPKPRLGSSVYAPRLASSGEVPGFGVVRGLVLLAPGLWSGGVALGELVFTGQVDASEPGFCLACRLAAAVNCFPSRTLVRSSLNGYVIPFPAFASSRNTAAYGSFSRVAPIYAFSRRKIDLCQMDFAVAHLTRAIVHKKGRVVKSLRPSRPQSIRAAQRRQKATANES